MRYMFELSFHTNYFRDNEDEPDNFVMVVVEGNEQLDNDMSVSSGAMVDLQENIEGDTVTHNYYGLQDNECSRHGYSIYEADETEMEEIIDMWTQGLMDAYGDQIKAPIRYSFDVGSDEDYEEKETAAFNLAFGA
jgi:hypothetical protein